MKLVTEEEVKKIIELYQSGLTQFEVGKTIGRHRETVLKVLKANRIKSVIGGRKSTDTKICVVCRKEFNGTRKRCDTCNTKIRRYRAKKAAVEYLGGKCMKCSWSGNLAAFDFHHKDPSEKDFNPSAVELANKSWELAKKELDKCELLCANCHRLKHNDYGNEEFLKFANMDDVDLIFKK